MSPLCRPSEVGFLSWTIQRTHIILLNKTLCLTIYVHVSSCVGRCRCVAVAGHDLVDPPGVRTQFGVNGGHGRVAAAVGIPQDTLQLTVAHQHAAVLILEAERVRGRHEGLRSAMWSFFTGTGATLRVFPSLYFLPLYTFAEAPTQLPQVAPLTRQLSEFSWPAQIIPGPQMEVPDSQSMHVRSSTVGTSTHLGCSTASSVARGNKGSEFTAPLALSSPQEPHVQVFIFPFSPCFSDASCTGTYCQGLPLLISADHWFVVAPTAKNHRVLNCEAIVSPPFSPINKNGTLLPCERTEY